MVWTSPTIEVELETLESVVARLREMATDIDNHLDQLHLFHGTIVHDIRRELLTEADRLDRAIADATQSNGG